MVDSNDETRFQNSAETLKELLQDSKLANAVLLVLANKQDLPGSASVATLGDRLELFKIKNRKWYIQGCCACDGTGLHEGVEWLGKSLE